MATSFSSRKNANGLKGIARTPSNAKECKIIPRNSKVLTNPRYTKEYKGIPRNSQEYTEMQRNTKDCKEIQKNTEEY